jgi:hypothetical protein
LDLAFPRTSATRTSSRAWLVPKTLDRFTIFSIYSKSCRRKKRRKRRQGTSPGVYGLRVTAVANKNQRKNFF